MSWDDWWWVAVGGLVLTISGRMLWSGAKARSRNKKLAWVGAGVMVIGEALVVGGLAIGVVELLN